MNNLFTYISALKFGSTQCNIVSEELHDHSYHDEGIFIDSKERIVQFSNGVLLKEQVEFDSEQTCDESLCPECWIWYQILAQPDELSITPKKKSFISRCQEAFWLKMHKIRMD